MLKLILEFGPVVVFFATYKYADIFKATLYMVVVTIGCLIASFLIDRKLSLPLMISGVILLISGFITLFSGDPAYIKMKPTIVYGIFSAALYIGCFMNKPILKDILKATVSMTNSNWNILSIRFGHYFLFMAVTNELIWRYFSENFWVNFKVFGALPITIVFFITQVPFLMRNKQDNSPL